MLERGGDLRLALEALAEGLVPARLRREELQRDRALRGRCAPRGRRCSCPRARSGTQGDTLQTRHRSAESSSHRSWRRVLAAASLDYQEVPRADVCHAERIRSHGPRPSPPLTGADPPRQWLDKRKLRCRVLTARPAGSADLAAVPGRRAVGEDRRARRAAEPRRHRAQPGRCGNRVWLPRQYVSTFPGPFVSGGSAAINLAFTRPIKFDSVTCAATSPSETCTAGWTGAMT